MEYWAWAVFLINPQFIRSHLLPMAQYVISDVSGLTIYLWRSGFIVGGKEDVTLLSEDTVDLNNSSISISGSFCNYQTRIEDNSY